MCLRLYATGSMLIDNPSRSTHPSRALMRRHRVDVIGDGNQAQSLWMTTLLIRTQFQYSGETRTRGDKSDMAEE